jgi:hypothetical protein
MNADIDSLTALVAVTECLLGIAAETRGDG